MKKLLVIFFFIFVASVNSYPAFAQNILIKQGDAITGSFLGFGVNWNTYDYNVSGVTNDDFNNIIASRTDWLRIPVVRIMMLSKYCYTGNNRFDWDSGEMRQIYRQLDLCQKQGTKVILTDWGCENSWEKVVGINSITDPEYARVIGKYMDYLVNKKGYTCIKWFTMVNEPDLEVRNWEKWRKSLMMVHDVFKSNGLSEKIALLGPDTANPGYSSVWLQNTFSNMDSIMGAYDVHIYAKKSTVRNGNLAQEWLGNYGYLLKGSLYRKPFLVGEVGMEDDMKPPAGSPHIDEYDYGIFMADCAIQAARAGVSGALAWMLDDNSHSGFYWGMWANKNKGLKVRPWFYAWGLLSRYIPMGSTIYSPLGQPADIRIIAARYPNMNKSGPDYWTICIVNRDNVPRKISISVQEGTNSFLRRFVYSQAEMDKKKGGFLDPVDAEKIDLKTGTRVECPANALVLLTTLPH